MYESQQMDRVCNILSQRAVILVEDWQQYLTVTIRTPSSPLVYIMQRNKQNILCEFCWVQAIKLAIFY